MNDKWFERGFMVFMFAAALTLLMLAVYLGVCTFTDKACT